MAAAKRRAQRDAERERKKQEEAAAKALAAVIDADLVVLDARRRATDLNSAMKTTHSTQEYKDLKAALDEVIRKGDEARGESEGPGGPIAARLRRTTAGGGAQPDGERRFSPRPKPPVPSLSAAERPPEPTKAPSAPLRSLPPPL